MDENSDSQLDGEAISDGVSELYLDDSISGYEELSYSQEISQKSWSTGELECDTSGNLDSSNSLKYTVTVEECNTGQACNSGHTLSAESQGEVTVDKQLRYKKIPLLNETFQKRQLSNGNVKNTCLACKTRIRTREIGRLVRHVRVCQVFEKSKKAVVLEDYEGKRAPSQKLNLLWAQVILENNIPLRTIESISFIKFARYVSPKWKIGSRHQYSSEFTPILAKRVENELFKRLCNSREAHISVEFDHWQDSNSRSLLGIVLTMTDGSRYLRALLDVTLEGHSADVIVEKVVQSLDGISSVTISSFVSESASSCRCAREMLVTLPRFKHAIHHRCLAHLLNLIGSHLTAKDQSLSKTLAWASKVTNSIAKCSRLQSQIKMRGSTKVRSACNVRWYSTVTMMESLIKAKSVILEEVRLMDSCDRYVIFEDEESWVTLENASSILRALANCIAISERKAGSIGESV